MSLIPYTEEERSRLAKLLVYKWKGASDEQIKRKIIWRYESNPFDIRDLIFLASHEDTLIGFRGFIPQLFVVNQQRLPVFIPADAVVHQSFRRRGVFSALNHKVLSYLQENEQGYGFILNLTSNKMSRPGNLKQGWQPALGYRTINYRLSLANYFFPAFFKKDLSLSKDSDSQQRTGIRFLLSKDLRPGELHRCWKNCHPQDKITLVRNEAYFSWRYAAPGARYVFLYAQKGEDTVGYLVLRKAKKSKYVLEEYHAISVSLLRQMAEYAQKELVITVLKTASMSQHQQKVLQDMGFTRSSGIWGKLFKTKHFPILLRPLGLEPKEMDYFMGDLDVRNMENWMLFQADAY